MVRIVLERFRCPDVRGPHRSGVGYDGEVTLYILQHISARVAGGDLKPDIARPEATFVIFLIRPLNFSRRPIESVTDTFGFV